jgi:hypothetical protein
MPKYPAILITAFAVTALACKGKEQPAPPTADAALATAAATKNLPAEHYVSPTEKFDISLPGVWTGKYRATEKKDTTMGARLAVEFKFIPDSGSKAPSLTLMTLRIVPKKAWDAMVAKGGAAMGAKIGERADEVFVLSLPSANPYTASSPEAPAYDNLIISIAQGGQQVNITTRP